ncbi:GLPGLI family protein [Chryseobacterium vrystaatense]|uniref:GLPGLI family protein n=1 Tax=Chryseobacterium vrystaatense TaxID=307480 RepID=A0A1M4WQD2_9FLAO|nr:GLPGLI family protein [Chryseobacterium vrystaatense]SHE83182.1 GLPGLI family protein [Chryseobacterium vrystaatense]
MKKIIVLFGISVCSLVGAQDIDAVQNSINEDGHKMLEIHKGSENNIQWKIESETKRLSDYNLQKATAVFEGRVLTAWFTHDVKISSKHYQLGGLPGVILFVEDGNKDFVYKTNVKKAYCRNIKKMPS